MSLIMSATSGVVLALLLSVVLLQVSSESKEKCLDGKYHKKYPSKESTDFQECHAWKDKSCCTAEFTVELAKHRVRNIWNFTWDHCSNLSQSCDKYLRDEECFFQCEPNLIKWHIGNAYVKRVPICSKYCDDWFEACKDDLTCVQDWLNDFNFSASSYTCPRGSKCLTYAERYKNGEGLCNQMWGPSFKYEKTSNCMVMDFSGANPNDKVTVITTSAAPRVLDKAEISIILGCVIGFFLF